MVPMASTDSGCLAAAERRRLVEVARASIEHGLAHGRALAVSASEYPAALKARRASFVTLHRDDELRGCIGHLEAVQPLVVDVAENAFAAAFRDPRFLPLTAAEWPAVSLHLSILSPPEALQFDSEAALVAQLRPRVDGVILQDGPNRGTFLPSVWDSLPDPADFLAHLKRKAGLAANHWSTRMAAWRYTAEGFGEDGEDSLA